jgi:phosphoribosylformylglycinamidine synthase
VKNSPAPYFDLDEEFTMQNAMKEAIKSGMLKSAHDCSDGGLFVTLMESAVSGNVGFEIKSYDKVRKDAFLFGESQSRVVITCNKGEEQKVIDLLEKNGSKGNVIGTVKGNALIVDGENFGSVNDFSDLYNNSLGEMLN